MLVVGLWVREVLPSSSSIQVFRYPALMCDGGVTIILPTKSVFTIIKDLMFSVIRMLWKNLNTCPLTRNVPNKTYICQKRFVHFTDRNKQMLKLK